MNPTIRAPLIAFLLFVGACGQDGPPPVADPGARSPSPPQAPAIVVPPATPTPSAAPQPQATPPAPPPSPTPPPAAAAEALETFEPSGEALSVPGLLPPPQQGQPYQASALEWAAIRALLEATPGVRVREHVGFYPPRPIDLTGRPAPFTFGHVTALFRVGWWRPAENAQFLIVPYHHEGKSMAFYAPAGEGQVRFITKFDARCSEQEHAVEGYLLTRPGDQVQVINLCGRGAELVVFRARDGRLVSSRQAIDPAAVVPPDPENGDDL